MRVAVGSAVVLFGSASTGSYSASVSDVDLLLIVDSHTALHVEKIEQLIERTRRTVLLGETTEKWLALPQVSRQEITRTPREQEHLLVLLSSDLSIAVIGSMRAWAGEGVKRVDVVCPGFAADCLETLEEIAMMNRDAFLEAGGESYSYVPALNVRADHMEFLLEFAAEQIADWLARPEAGDDERALQVRRAREEGAVR
jgi:predicted nucleotidyltransferase